MVDVDLVDAGRHQDVALQVRRLRAVGLRDPARLALSHHIDSRPTPPAGTAFGLIVIPPPPYDPNVPHHDLDVEAEVHRLNVEYWPTATAVH